MARDGLRAIVTGQDGRSARLAVGSAGVDLAHAVVMKAWVMEACVMEACRRNGCRERRSDPALRLILIRPMISDMRPIRLRPGSPKIL
ncbi:hypothetical protein VQ03_15870 [Methylobacterium tarhaniae]|uniref:Uncharacterized protein n=1 Tax=Methylobacterium tarhaniae TaxID=1187852 RepID=A0A0J6VJL6_9HYPH|nr:hypothetical protein VQ03_15870 [Methylobacterium tarhaniae]